MLRLFTPANALNERRYVADVLLRNFLGLELEVRQHDRNEVFLTNGGDQRLVLDDSFFSELNEPLVREDKLPSIPLKSWRLTESGFDATLPGLDLPVLFGKPLTNGSYVACGDKEIRLGVDILGSAFFMLTRYEELVSSQRDSYDRVPARASIAYRAGFLDRPIVNEYVELLWQCLNRLWRGLVRRKREFRIILSHDVDQPFLLRKDGFTRVLRTMVGDTVKRKNLVQGLKRPAQWLRACILGPEQDPAYTFEYIMDVAEERGLRSAFYFIPSVSAGPPDYRYGIQDPDIQRLISRIHTRGHELGYHASIETYRDGALMQQEMDLLRHGCEKAGVEQESMGSRQHYLRIATPVTLRHLAAARLAYDTSLAYADHAGFRCGTCWEYPFYDLERRMPLGIVERPLIVMECSVMDDQYMSLGCSEKALDLMLRLARACRRVSGDFTLLWHNTRVVSMKERRLFEAVLKGICA